MTAPTTAASNGHTKPRPSPEARPAAWPVSRKPQGYYLASVARDAAGEAERLCSDIDARRTRPSTRRRNRRCEADGHRSRLVAKANEAMACLATAVIYLGRPVRPA